MKCLFYSAILYVAIVLILIDYVTLISVKFNTQKLGKSGNVFLNKKKVTSSNINEKAKTRRFDVKSLLDGNSLKIENENIKLSNYAGIVYLGQKNRFKLINSEPNDKHHLVAEVFFYKSLNEKGWDKLSLNTYKSGDKFSPFLQSYLGGYLEGRLTYRDTHNFLSNMEYNTKKSDPNLRIFKSIKGFFSQVEAAMYNNVSNFNEVYLSEADRDYYYKIFIFYTQLKGLLQGHNKSVEFSSNKTRRLLTIEDLLIIQADGEIPELMRYFRYKISGRKHKLGEKDYFRTVFDINYKKPEDIWEKIMTKSRCSAMIKLTTDEDGKLKDLFSGHTAWSDYSEMYRTYKHYYMELRDYLGKDLTVETTFSSYPGCLSSTDDYYITNNKLMVTETTLEIIDINLYSKVKDISTYIPNFMRVNSATFFSKTASEWIENFSHFNSGTYSSQWMILDYKVFEKAKKTGQKVNNLLHVLEQTPSTIVSHDVSEYLYNNKYYASFNRAFFTETDENLHTQLINELYGDMFTYKGAMRGKIFKRFEPGIKKFRQFKNVMRYNGYNQILEDFPDDPSVKSPGHGISARFDLEKADMTNLSGGLDCKMTNSQLIKNLTSVIQSGPTIENNENLPVFDWSAWEYLNIVHEGIPEKFNFPWLLENPDIIKNNKSDKFVFSK